MIVNKCITLIPYYCDSESDGKIGKIKETAVFKLMIRIRTIKLLYQYNTFTLKEC